MENKSGKCRKNRRGRGATEELWADGKKWLWILILAITKLIGNRGYTLSPTGTLGIIITILVESSKNINSRFIASYLKEAARYNITLRTVLIFFCDFELYICLMVVFSRTDLKPYVGPEKLWGDPLNSQMSSKYWLYEKLRNGILRYECDETSLAFGSSCKLTLVKKTFFARVSYEILYDEVWKCGFPHAKRALNRILHTEWWKVIFSRLVRVLDQKIFLFVRIKKEKVYENNVSWAISRRRRTNVSLGYV